MKKYFLGGLSDGVVRTSAALRVVRKSIPLRIRENSHQIMFTKVRKLFTDMFINLLTFTNTCVTIITTGTERR